MISQIRMNTVLWGFSITALIMAYGAEYGLGYKPCVLCLYQRYILMTLCGLSLMGFTYSIARKGAWIVLACSLGLNTYQIGVEQKFWKPLDACIQKSIDMKSIAHLPPAERIKAFQAHSLKSPLTRCDEVKWRILGFPTTVWMEITLMGLFFLGFWACRKSRDG